MSTETAGTIIDGAYRVIKVGDPSSEQDNVGLEALNDMISLWSADNLLIVSITNETLTLAIGTRQYAIGSGATFNTDRPIQIYNALLRDSSNIDTPLDIYTKKEYNKIADKTTNGRPTNFVYIPSFPTGTIIFNLSADKAYSFIIDSYKPLTELAALTTTVNLPDNYKLAIKYNLSLILADYEDSSISQNQVFIAEESKKVIRALSSSPIPEVMFDNYLFSRKSKATQDITVL